MTSGLRGVMGYLNGPNSLKAITPFVCGIQAAQPEPMVGSRATSLGLWGERGRGHIQGVIILYKYF